MVENENDGSYAYVADVCARQSRGKRNILLRYYHAFGGDHRVNLQIQTLFDNYHDYSKNL